MNQLSLFFIDDVQLFFKGNVCLKANMINDAHMRPEYHQTVLAAMGVTLTILDDLNNEQIQSVKDGFNDYIIGIELFEG